MDLLVPSDSGALAPAHLPTFVIPQGIGDIFWVYQKLAPHFPKFNFEVLIGHDNVIEKRSREFISLLPQVAELGFTQTDHEELQRVACGKFSLPPLGTVGRLHYGVNKWLEEGTSLYAIDPGAEVARFVDLGAPVEVPKVNRLCAFVAGAKAEGLWSPEQWGWAFVEAARVLGVDGVDFIGAEWDRENTEWAMKVLGEESPEALDITSSVGKLGLMDSVAVIRRSKLFFGYQSGLHVLAENYNVPQLEVIFDWYPRMGGTWSKPGSKNFHSMLFKELPQLGDILQKTAADL